MKTVEEEREEGFFRTDIIDAVNSKPDYNEVLLWMSWHVKSIISVVNLFIINYIVF